MLESGFKRCCFCGDTPAEEVYVELSLRIARSPAVQWFGAHRACLEARLASGFNVELDSLG